MFPLRKRVSQKLLPHKTCEYLENFWKDSSSEVLQVFTACNCGDDMSLSGSVADQDPNPDPSDPCVFGPPGSGSGSFYHQAKNYKKNLDSYCFVTTF